MIYNRGGVALCRRGVAYISSGYTYGGMTIIRKCCMTDIRKGVTNRNRGRKDLIAEYRRGMVSERCRVHLR